jgi:hypothetical protein
MTVKLDNLDFKYLHKKLCCQNCQHRIVEQFSELETSADVIIALTKLRQINGTRTLSAKLERQIDALIKEKQK